MEGVRFMKILTTFIIVVLVLGGFGAVATTGNMTRQSYYSVEDEIDISSFDDELDQYQTIRDTHIELGYVEGSNCIFAQSFTPTKDILTRVQLFLIKAGSPQPCVVSIRKELDSENLTQAIVSASEIPYDDPEWIEFDFDDIDISVGETYYMVASTSGGIYGLSIGENNPYSNGSFYYCVNWGEWGNVDDLDFCFKTYGRNTPLRITEITGGFGKICVEINNNHDSAIEDITWSITVQGGILNRINVVTEGTIDVLDEGASEIVCTDRFIFGLGPIEITATAESNTAGISTRTSGGTVLLFFIIIQ